MTGPHFSRRMCEQYPYGAEYGCAITRYRRKARAADWALYIVAALGIVTALVFNNFH